MSILALARELRDMVYEALIPDDGVKYFQLTICGLSEGMRISPFSADLVTMLRINRDIRRQFLDTIRRRYKPRIQDDCIPSRWSTNSTYLHLILKHVKMCAIELEWCPQWHDYTHYEQWHLAFPKHPCRVGILRERTAAFPYEYANNIRIESIMNSFFRNMPILEDVQMFVFNNKIFDPNIDMRLSLERLFEYVPAIECRRSLARALPLKNLEYCFSIFGRKPEPLDEIQSLRHRKIKDETGQWSSNTEVLSDMVPEWPSYRAYLKKNWWELWNTDCDGKLETLTISDEEAIRGLPRYGLTEEASV